MAIEVDLYSHTALPSGTMRNEIALRVHFEARGPAALAGVNVQALDVTEAVS